MALEYVLLENSWELEMDNNWELEMDTKIIGKVWDSFMDFETTLWSVVFENLEYVVVSEDLELMI